MKCNKCPFYVGGLDWNRCDVTKDEYFHQQKDCNLVNDNGIKNKNNIDEYFKMR